jgi:hypothetical protein
MKPQTSARKTRGTGVRGRLAALTAVLAVFAAPASAQAITVSGTAAPTDPTAGAHSDFNIHMDFAGGQVKDLTVGLPPGVVGNPNAAPLCTVAQLNASACPGNTQVGEVSAVANVVSLPLPITVDGQLFNLAPQPGEPARFGIVLSPPVGSDIILQSAVQLRPDFGLNSIINGIPNTTVLPGDTTIVSQDITLYGIAPGTGRPFMRNPTSCGAATTAFFAVPHSGAAGSAQASFTPTNCGAVPFSPAFSAKITAPGPFTGGQKVAVSTTIAQDNGEAGLRDAVVLVPSDLAAEVSQIAPSELCPAASFQAAACPPASVVGSATATSPLLTQALIGPVMLVASGSTIPNIGLDLTGPLTLRLTGQLALDNSATFTGLPDIPISTFALRFIGGPNGLLFTKRDLCEPPLPTFYTGFVSHSGASQGGATPATVDCVPAPKCKVKGKKKKAKKKRKGKGKASAVVAGKKQAAKKKKKKAKKKKNLCKKKKKGKKKKGKRKRR